MIVRPGTTRSSNHSPLTCQSNCVIKKKDSTVKPLIVAWPVVYSTRQRKKLHLTYYEICEENMDCHKQLDFSSLCFLCVPTIHHLTGDEKGRLPFRLPTPEAGILSPWRAVAKRWVHLLQQQTTSPVYLQAGSPRQVALATNSTSLPCEVFPFWERAGQVLPHGSAQAGWRGTEHRRRGHGRETDEKVLLPWFVLILAVPRRNLASRRGEWVWTQTDEV